MKLTPQNIEKIKREYGACCHYCSTNAVEHVWVDLESWPMIAGFYRCSAHLPDFSEIINIYYKLNEKEMFLFKIL